MDWKFNPDNYDPDGFSIIPEGNYRVRIDEAEETTSRKSGKPMIKLTLSVSGSNSKLWSYTVLDATSEETTKRTDNYLGKIFDCFKIQPGNMNISSWVGKTGGAKVRHGKDDNGNTRAEIHYFLKRSDVDALPAWRDENSTSAGFQNYDDFAPIEQENTAEDCPF